MTFNWVGYRDLNPDLKKAGLITSEEFYKHFINYGIKERRQFNLILPDKSIYGPIIFNWETYKNCNPDLVKAGLKTKEQFEKHFIVYGIKEGRIVNPVNKIPKQFKSITSVVSKAAKVNNMYNSLVLEKNIREYFKGKRVAIIAPSPSVRETENGDEIDKYDIVVRVNKNWKYSPELNKYVGKRTDIVYNCINQHPECGGTIDFEYVKNNLKYIAISIPIINDQKHRDKLFHNNTVINQYRQFVINNNNKVKYYIVNKDLYNMYDNILNSRPNTGFMAILDILSYDIKELYIKGFTFFRDGYLSNYRNTVFGEKTDEQSSASKVNNIIRKYGNHDIDKQIDLFKKIYYNKKNIIKIDPAMKRILEII
jgi:hypothetical protein